MPRILSEARFHETMSPAASVTISPSAMLSSTVSVSATWRRRSSTVLRSSFSTAFSLVMSWNTTTAPPAAPGVPASGRPLALT